MDAGTEVREARIACGLRQSDLSKALGWSTSKLGRIERGDDSHMSARDLARAASLVGLRLSLKLYPAPGRLRDAAQLAMQERFLTTVRGGVWFVLLEDALPLPGDLRAFDVTLRGPVSVGVEFLTRLRDVQAQVRAATQKQRDSRVDRVILVIRNTHANRRAVREAAPVLGANFPVRTKAVLSALRHGRDPGGNAVVFW